MIRIASFVLLILSFIAPPAQAQQTKYDPDNAKDVMRVCAACHGEFGEGGGGGVYPRLSGLPEKYLALQIRKFKDRSRENIPMIPYATERELPENEVRNISIYLAEIKLQNRMPVLDPKMDAFERLMIAKKILQVPRAAGDTDKGGAIYQRECAACHGKNGEGRGDKPLLAGQHTKYLVEQIGRYQRKEREHPDADELFQPLSENDWQNIFAYLSILDD